MTPPFCLGTAFGVNSPTVWHIQMPDNAGEAAMIRSILLSSFIAAAPAAALAGPVNIIQTPLSLETQSEISYPKIAVSGSTKDAYDTVDTKKLTAWVTVSSDGKPNGAAAFERVRINIGSYQKNHPTIGAPKVYKVTFNYTKPRAKFVANDYVSPITLCNSRLQSKSGAARETFLKEGESFVYTDAYRAEAIGVWRRAGSGFVHASDETMLYVRISCLPLEGPQVRTSTTTTGSSGGPRASEVGPTRTNPPPVRTNPPPVRTNPDPVDPPEAPADFDVRIRGADREGPDGAVQMWVYNAGPDDAVGCSVEWRPQGANGFTRVANLPPIAERETLKVETPLPSNPNSEFRVDCAGEPEDAQGNNGFLLE